MKLYKVTVNEKHFAKEMLPHISIPNVYVIADNEADAMKLAADKFKQSLQWMQEYTNAYLNDLVVSCESTDTSKEFVSEVIC